MRKDLQGANKYPWAPYRHQVCLPVTETQPGFVNIRNIFSPCNTPDLPFVYQIKHIPVSPYPLALEVISAYKKLPPCVLFFMVWISTMAKFLIIKEILFILLFYIKSDTTEREKISDSHGFLKDRHRWI